MEILFKFDLHFLYILKYNNNNNLIYYSFIMYYLLCIMYYLGKVYYYFFFYNDNNKNQKSKINYGINSKKIKILKKKLKKVK